MSAPFGENEGDSALLDGADGAQKLSEDSFLNGENANYGAMFANKISVNCP